MAYVEIEQAAPCGGSSRLLNQCGSCGGLPGAIKINQPRSYVSDNASAAASGTLADLMYFADSRPPYTWHEGLGRYSDYVRPNHTEGYRTRPHSRGFGQQSRQLMQMQDDMPITIIPTDELQSMHRHTYLASLDTAKNVEKARNAIAGLQRAM